MANPYSSDADVFLGDHTAASQANPFTDAAAQQDPFGGDGAFQRQVHQSPQSSAVMGAPTADPFAQPQAPQPAASPVQAAPPAAATDDLDFFTGPPPVQQAADALAPAPAPQQVPPPAPGEFQPVDAAQQQQAGSPRAPVERTMKCWKMGFYQQYFDVDTDDVVHRLLSSFTPWREPTYLKTHGYSFATLNTPDGWFVGEGAVRPDALPSSLSTYPDLYGPLWVTTTLWIVLAVFGHMASMLSFRKTSADDHWSYSLAWSLAGAAVVYGFAVGVPLLLYFVMKCNGCPVGLLNTCCLYGYSMTPFVVAGALCLIPVTALQWVFVGLAAAVSLASVVMNLCGAWKRHLPANWFVAVVSAVCVLHLVPCLFIKLFCFGSDPGDF
eukprot:TRINITY_DN5444_c0_g3_i1.p1 TRINITY_DN5444_c0_g3~~TRINITY_DN5444_c0_g3_i1.p1  ORF type:complete len:382 (+),score=89.97 TRINITY_DN5444_c0_g3_i1:77-1222(+)